jgi:phenylalanyl-tRNA synthetase alpha chain
MHPFTAPSPPASSPATWPFGTSPTPPKAATPSSSWSTPPIAPLAAGWNCQVRWHREPRVVPVEDNYDRLRIPPDAVSRDVRYTRYVDGRRMLRSHSTAMVPSALRTLAAEPADDTLVVCPGVVYRRDAIDRLHAATPHQLDLWRITRRSLNHADLRDMVRLLVQALAPGRPYRWEPRVHPYTLDGRQVDVCWDGEWIEVWECGLAHPEVLAHAGLAGWSGLALGMGLDRLLMLRKGIPDIRLLRSADPRIAGQMAALVAYRPVSAMPPVRRDLSVAVDADDGAEDLGDRVRHALGPDAEAVESPSWPRRPMTSSRPRPSPGSASARARRTSWSGSSCATSSGP